MRGEFSSYEEKEENILGRLYAIQLNEIREKLKSDDKDIEKNLDVYFAPATPRYKKNNYHRVNEKNSDQRETRYEISISHRMGAFAEVVKKDELVLSNEQKNKLRAKVADILEQSADDISSNLNNNSLIGLEDFINLCDFSKQQKEALNESIFNMMLSHKNRDPLDHILSQPDFPYTKEQLDKIFTIARQGDIGPEGLRLHYHVSRDDYENKDRRGTYYRSSSLETLANFPFTEEQKDILRKPIFDAKKKEILELHEKGEYFKLINQIKTFESSEPSFLGTGLNSELGNFASSFVLETLKKQVDREISYCSHKITNALDIKNVLKDIPNEFKQEAEAFIESKKILWQEDLENMLVIQGRSRRLEYDPWTNQINPLVDRSIRLGVLSLDKKEDGTLLLEYIKKIGAQNLPEYFALFAEIKRSGSLDQMSQKLKQSINDEFSVDVNVLCENDPKNLNLIFNEMEKYRKSFAEDIMNDTEGISERALKSPLMKELFSSVIGGSGHTSGGDLEQVLNTYKTSVKKKPEAFDLKEGYEITQIEVKTYQEYSEINKENITKETGALFSNPDLILFYKKVHQGIGSLDNSSSFGDKLNKVTQEFRQEETLIKNKIQEEEQKEVKNEKALENLKRRESNFSKQRDAFTSFRQTASSGAISLMETYNKLIPDDFKSKSDILLELSVQDIAEVFPEQISILKNKDLFPETLNADGVSVLTEFLKSHIGEHYLNKKHGEQQAIKTDDKNLLKYLRKAWGTQDFDTGILAITKSKLDVLERGEISDKTKTITLIPSKGIQRIYSGNLGGACTSRKSMELAKGDFENITSYSFVMDKDTPKEKFAGSFLVVETQTKDGEPALILRANNPIQSLSSTIDVDELVNKTIQEVKDIAQRRGINIVGVASASGSSSNRSFVHNYYSKNLPENYLKLKDNKDTNFNGYDITTSCKVV